MPPPCWRSMTSATAWLWGCKERSFSVSKLRIKPSNMHHVKNTRSRLTVEKVSMPFLIRYTRTYVNINRRVDNLSNHYNQGLCSSTRSQSLRLGLTHDVRGAFICDAWTGSFSEARGESARRQGHNMDLAQLFLDCNLCFDIFPSQTKAI